MGENPGKTAGIYRKARRQEGGFIRFPSELPNFL
jgi:hypothetical protein